MSRWINCSGSALNVPSIGRDVEDGEEVDVPDDAPLPENYFRRVDTAAPYAQPAPVENEGE